MITNVIFQSIFTFFSLVFFIIRITKIKVDSNKYFVNEKEINKKYFANPRGFETRRKNLINDSLEFADINIRKHFLFLNRYALSEYILTDQEYNDEIDKIVNPKPAEITETI